SMLHKQDLYQKTGYDPDGLPGDSFLSRATREHFRGREYLTHSSLLFFIWPKNRGIGGSSLANPFAKVPKGLPDRLAERAEEFGKAVRDAVNFLGSGPYLRLRPFNQASILQYTDGFFNGFNAGFDTDMVMENNKIMIGEDWFSALAINHEDCFGERLQSSRPHGVHAAEGFQFHQGFIDALGLDLSGNHLVNQIIHLDDTHFWRRKIEKQLEELSKSSNFGSMNKVLFEKLSRTVEQINQDDSARLVRGQMSVVFWERDKADLDRRISELSARFKAMDMRPYLPCGQARVRYVMSSYPLFSSNFSYRDLYL